MSAFEQLKKKIITAPVLQDLNWNLPFHIHSDASDATLGEILGPEKEKQPYATYYISKNLAGAKLNYTVTKTKFLVVFHTINKFWHYIIRYPVFVHIDNSAIRYLMNKP